MRLGQERHISISKSLRKVKTNLPLHQNHKADVSTKLSYRFKKNPKSNKKAQPKSE